MFSKRKSCIKSTTCINTLTFNSTPSLRNRAFFCLGFFLKRVDSPLNLLCKFKGVNAICQYPIVSIFYIYFLYIIFASALCAKVLNLSTKVMVLCAKVQNLSAKAKSTCVADLSTAYPQARSADYNTLWRVCQELF